jgi:hypothetical protein
VDLDDLVELLLGHLTHGGVASDARVVDRDVKRPERARRGVEEPGHVVGGGDLAIDADRVGIQGRRGFPGFGLVEVADDDPGPVVGEGTGDRQPDAWAPPVITAVRPVSMVVLILFARSCRTGVFVIGPARVGDLSIASIDTLVQCLIDYPHSGNVRRS